MKILIDTNILIPLEPTRISDIAKNVGEAASLLRLVGQAGVTVYLHPRQLDVDVQNDKDTDRRELRLTQAKKYNVLVNPPHVRTELVSILGEPSEGTNDWVDNQLLAALDASACDFIVTEDKGVHRKSKRINLADRVLTLADALDVLQNLFDQPIEPPPAVRKAAAYEMDKSDPIWESFRDDYQGFDRWFDKVCREHRPVFVIDSQSGLAGVAIINKEENPPCDMDGKVLKICSFKVAQGHSGNRYGELLLKTIFSHIVENNYDWVFVEVLEKHSQLIALFIQFGFTEIARKDGNELILAKPMHPDLVDEDLAGLEYHLRYGPAHLDWSQPAFLVPIQPKFEEMLFPDRPRDQPSLPLETRPYGNAIRKAYLCFAQTKQIQPGSILAFYRSGDEQAVTSIAVVEDVMRSENAEEITTHVARRTVYRLDEIREMVAKRPVLSIRFRQSMLLTVPIRLNAMIATGFIKAAPQSISRLSEKGKEWLSDQIQ